MVGRAKSDAEKDMVLKREKDLLMSHALAAYLAKLEKPYRSRRGLRTICRDFEKLYFAEKGVPIRLSYVTLGRLADGGLTCKEANLQRCWLTPIEEQVVVDFLIEIGQQGWPESHRRIKEHINCIAGARLGEKFPSTGVGKNWTARFMLRHSDQIKMGYSRPLEDKRGQAVNPTANSHFWGMLKHNVDHYKITPRTTYGADEIGVQHRGQERERVATSSKKKGPQYQQRAGTRENTTVIVTICADGTSTPPTVIFKGAVYQVSWGDNNPLNASIGYQKKGWTSGEIGAEWIKIFNEQTKDKVNEGEYRLLLVDGHNSHFTVDFLLYACEHLIVVLCYIPHSTHIFQGLDVVIFSPLKKFLGEERDKWLRENGTAMDKNNFLAVYGRAHVRALTPANIKAAFKKTGVWPFNLDIVTEDMLATSKATSSAAHLPSPINDPAVNVLATMFRKLATINEAEDGLEVISDAPIEGPSDLTKHDVISEAVVGLSQTKLAHLISTTLTTSKDAMPTADMQIMPHPNPSPLLNIQLETKTKILLLVALRESYEANKSLADRNIALRAGNLLNEVYCGNARGALQSQEKKKERKRGGTLPDGLACLLSGDTFYETRVNFEKDRQTEEHAKKTRKDARAAWKEAMAEWQKAEDKRKALKEREAAKHERAVEAWQAANALEGRGRGHGRGGGAAKTPKPKMAAIPKQAPRPLLKHFLAGGIDEQLGGEDSDEREEGSATSEGTGSEDDEDDNEDDDE